MILWSITLRDNPRIRRSPSDSVSNSPSTSSSVSLLTTTELTGASSFRRDARFTASPTTPNSVRPMLSNSAPMTSSPLCTPIRTASGVPGSAPAFASRVGTRLTSSSARSHRAFGIVLMRGGIAEIDENSVAAVGRYETPVALHRRQPFALVPQLQIPEVFGIHLFRQLRISNQIAEHDRQVTPLQSDRRTRAVSFDFHSIPGRRRLVSRAPPSETLAPMVACLQSDRLDEASGDTHPGHTTAPSAGTKAGSREAMSPCRRVKGERRPG